MINDTLVVLIESECEYLTDLLVQYVMEWVVIEKEEQGVVQVCLGKGLVNIFKEDLVYLG